MNRLILFAHWDAAAEVKPYILTPLKALNALGGQVEFVSNCPLPPAHADLTQVDELVLVNSSVVGPFSPLAPIFERMTATGWDFASMKLMSIRRSSGGTRFPWKRAPIRRAALSARACPGRRGVPIHLATEAVPWRSRRS